MGDRIILTPPQGNKPEITGARVYGVRPGREIFFAVRAAGKKPFKFYSEGLPDFAELNINTGIITGKTPAKSGVYNFRVTVTNSFGEDTASFTFKVGEEICLTPPMGWNSWYCYSESVSDEKIRYIARQFVEKGLIDYGWTFINIDDCWQGARGGKYNALQGNERFPDMKGLVDYIHGLGLKLGIYSTPWIGSYAGFRGGSCPNPDGDYSEIALPENERPQPHQIFGRSPRLIKLGLNRIGKYSFTEKDALQWAEWGIDYVKYDWAGHDVETIRRLYTELRNSGRDIIFSLSNNIKTSTASDWTKYVNLWRTTGDITDTWRSIKGIGLSQDKWKPFTRPGHWIDPDMLQVGKLGTPNTFVEEFRDTRLTPDEQYFQISLWSLLSAPLILSCEVGLLDDFTLGLLKNKEVIDINQDPLGDQAVCIYRKFGKVIYAKKLEGGDIALGLFNLRRRAADITFKWSYLDLKGYYAVRDVWRRQYEDKYIDKYTATVNPHGVKLVILRRLLRCKDFDW